MSSIQTSSKEMPDRHEIHVNMTVRALRFPSGRGDRPHGVYFYMIGCRNDASHCRTLITDLMLGSAIGKEIVVEEWIIVLLQ